MKLRNMTRNQKNTLVIALVLLSALISIIGALFKLQHYPYGSELLITSTLFWLVSIGLIISTALKSKKGRTSEDV